MSIDRRIVYAHTQFLATCKGCNANTSRKYAREHGGLCKRCVTSETQATAGQVLGLAPYPEKQPTREARILESGYAAYAREEGHHE